MNKDENISEEQLNAFVDGELEPEETSCVFNDAEQSEELNQRLCQQRKLKELIKHAYREVPEPKRAASGSRIPGSMLNLALAASILLVLGLASGFLAHGFLDQEPGTNGYAAANNQAATMVSENYILHVASGEPAQMQGALQQARALLSTATPGKPRQVEIVANEQGLDLLRSDVTQFSEEIRALANEKVLFYACSKAVQRLQEQGVEVRLVPEAIAGFTALDRVVIRMKDGWQYIKI